MANTRRAMLAEQFAALPEAVGTLATQVSPASIVKTLAGAAYKGGVPVNARQFIKGLVGDTSGVSEGDLWPSDKEALKAAVSHAITDGPHRFGLDAANNTPQQGVFDYNDYGIKSGAFAVGREGTREDKTLWNIIKSSYTDPAFRMATTVGGAVYGKNPDGTTSIKDTYDFDYPQKAPEVNDLVKALMYGASTDSVLERAGNRLIGNASTGYNAQPYTLNIGKVP